MLASRWSQSWTMVGILTVGCGAERAAPVDLEPPPQVLASTARPAGWQEHSHGNDAAPDYARLFPDDRVQRIDLQIAAEVHRAALDDLGQRLGVPGGGPSAAVTACSRLTQGAPCSFLGLKGTCATSGRTLACRAADQAGAIDMVPGDPMYFPVTVRYGGSTWNHVGMRFKGNSSLTGPFHSGTRKLGFRLNFDKYEGEHPEVKNQRFYGFGEMTFSSGFSDPTLIREKLAADLLRDAGLVAAHAAFYQLFVDVGSGPQYWGLYTMVEDPSDRLIEAQFDDPSGNVYKPDGPGADFTRFDERGFEKKSNEDDEDFSDVKATIEALHAPRDDAAAWRARLERTFDVDTFLHNLAIGRAIDHWDSYGQMSHNYYLYGDPAQGGRLVWISWDHNMTWTGGRGRSTVIPTNVGTRWPLIRNLMADPVYAARYRELLGEFAATVYDKASFDARATAMHQLVAPFVVGPQGERAPYTFLRNEQSFRSGLTNLIAAADARRSAIAQALAPPATPASNGTD